MGDIVWVHVKGFPWYGLTVSWLSQAKVEKRGPLARRHTDQLLQCDVGLSFALLRLRMRCRWPGQVMGMSQVSEKMKEDKQPHTKPISTFGDGQYCWALPLNILKFEERHPCYKVPKRLALVRST